MNIKINPLFSFLVLTLVTSCGPRDVLQDKNSKSGGGSAGSPFVLSTQGEVASTCPQKKIDRKDLGSPESSDEQIFAGKITASLEAGKENCYRIGSEVNLQNGKNGPIRGKLIVTKAEVVAISDLAEEHAKAMGMSLTELKNFANTAIQSAPYKSYDMVSITYFRYASGGGKPEPTTDMITIDKEGERAASCPADFKDSNRLIFSEDMNELIKEGKINAAMEAGDRNCFRIGSLVNWQNSKSGPVVGSMTVVKVQIVHKSQLGKEQAKALNVKQDELLKLAEEKISSVKFDAMGLVHITYFSVDGKTGGDTDGGTTENAPILPIIANGCSLKAFFPDLKSYLLEVVKDYMNQKKIMWDSTTFSMSEVKMQPVLFNDGKVYMLPAFEVSLKTTKGSDLRLTNYDLGHGKEKYFVMSREITADNTYDIEGLITNQVCIWPSVGVGLSTLLQKPRLFNKVSDHYSEILQGSELDKFSLSQGK
ncbi:MAG: ASCH domain-containing protein [Bdellovibrionaceae bacterium]|nr:ASCH domain-containing protein [Pseudobdellovibrionaceae bacterium]